MENFELIPGWLMIKWIFLSLGYDGLSFILLKSSGVGGEGVMCVLLDGVLLLLE